nr:hypothetical protein [Bacteroidota bacterium]
MNPEPIKKIYHRFITSTVILAIILSAVYSILLVAIPRAYLSPAIPWTIIFFLIITLGIFYLQLKVSLRKTSRFANFFMLATAGKLILFLLIIISYSFIYRADAINFIVAFFVIYLVFTVYEVIQILNIQQRIKELTKKNG